MEAEIKLNKKVNLSKKWKTNHNPAKERNNAEMGFIGVKSSLKFLRNKISKCQPSNTDTPPNKVKIPKESRIQRTSMYIAHSC